MRAMVLKAIGSLKENPAPLELVELPDPVPNSGQVQIRVSACGVCHTELDEIEGAPRRQTYLSFSAIRLLVKLPLWVVE